METEHRPTTAEERKIWKGAIGPDDIHATWTGDTVLRLIADVERQAPLVEELVGALARRPIPPSDANVFRALGDPVRWMDSYRRWYDSTRVLLARVREAPIDRGKAQEQGA